MQRSQPAPGLGKGQNSLIGYLSDARTMLTISAAEEEAERLYYAVISASLCKGAFTILAKDLARRSPDGAAYLTWLITRGHKWPTVATAA